MADIVEAEDCPWDYQPIMSHDGDNIKVSFCPVPTPEVQAEIMAASALKQNQVKRHQISLKAKNKARGQSLDVNLSLMTLILILRKN